MFKEKIEFEFGSKGTRFRRVFLEIDSYGRFQLDDGVLWYRRRSPGLGNGILGPGWKDKHVVNSRSAMQPILQPCFNSSPIAFVSTWKEQNREYCV
mmetsp:Transcript_22924/g.54118  ORF Transcript_22924/g.54118 Transcript_22924/m.54118 type:complete len:96 (+) Transcript_22924:1782-2069(+)